MSILFTRRRQTRLLMHGLCALIAAFYVAFPPPNAAALDETTAADGAATATVTDTPPTAATTMPSEPATDQPVSLAQAATPAPSITTGPQQPTGASAPTYTYNETTGLWENDQYTWDPATQQTKPKAPPTYSYNPATGMWDTTEWQYDAPSGKYVENIVSVTAPPTGSHVQATPLAKSGPSSATSPTPSSDNLKGLFDLFYNATISNHIVSSSSTGDANVSNNTNAGNALSGTATAIANLINLLQSSWDTNKQGALSTFVSNMFGDVYGDLLIDPSILAQNSTSTPTNIAVTASGSAAIDTTVDVAAASGNTNVSTNTSAGNASSGDSYALANIINAISSSISAGGSFFGILNIFGNLNGDILLPSQLINLLGGNPNNTSQALTAPNATVSSVSQQNTTTTVTSTAVSGAATVANNTSAGNATSGNAVNTITILNLTGRQIVGHDAFLVFVNVLGHWVGLIVDAPAGARSAALGDPSATSTALPSTLSSTDNLAITTNLSLSATSGSASVENNTSAGNATSGNAATSAQIANITDSSLSLTGWFGILFINVFGNWYGSFGIDTDAGEVPTSSSGPTNTMPEQPAVNTLLTHKTNHGSTVTVASNTDGTNGNVLLASAIVDTPLSSLGTNDPTSPQGASPSFLFPILGSTLGILLLTGERLYAYLRRRSAPTSN